MFFPVNVPMCTPIDTCGIFALLWWYILAYKNIYIRWFNENLFRKSNSSSFWHTHARTHATEKVYRGPRPCPIESRQIWGLSLRHACTCSTFHFNSLTLFAYKVLSWFCRLLIFFKISLFVVVVFFPKKSFGNISRVSRSLDPEIMPDFLLGLIWVQVVCKGYQQTTLVSKEFMTTIQANSRVDIKLKEHQIFAC